MKVYDAPNIRNIALVGHGGCGKTSLASAMLFDMGAVNRLGRVDDGTAPTDFDPDEIERKISLQTALAWGEWRKTKINLLDAPGYANFLAEARAALRVADAALVVVDSVAGVEVQTEKVWGYAEEYGIPRLIVVNRMDRERASYERTLQSLERAFGRGAVPVVIPLGEEKGFVGVTDLLGEKSDVYSEDQSGKFQAVEVPAEFREMEKAQRDRLVEMVAESNEELMEEFFDKGTLPPADLGRGLRQAVLAGRIFPVLPASSLRNVGLQPILDAMVDLLPSPAERGDVAGTDPVRKTETTRKPSPNAPFSAFVFKTIADPHAGRLSLFRVYSGTLKADSNVHNASRDASERVGALELLQGKNQTPVPEIQAGDLGAVAKLKETQTGDTLCDKASPIIYPPLVFPEPATTFAIEPKTRGDEDKISAALQRLMEEDRVLRLSRDPQTHEMRLSGMGQLHMEVVVGKLRKRYKVEVNLKKPKIPYRETIKAPAEGHGRHKKQTGGHGQFGDCKIRMKPLSRGEDFKFVDDIFGGSIPKNFIPAVEKGIQEARLRGFVAGYPMVDFQVELFDGQYHDVDSSEMSFKIAGSLAFKDAVAKCRPTILEPIMKVEIAVPEDFAGAVMGDLSSRRGRPQGMEPKGSLQVIRAEVPMSEMLSYDAELTSMTGGRGSYHMEMGHYDEVPAHLQEKIVATARAERGEVKEEE
ncbi:MAG TPA: elongation factor G [Vicinamibacteria bacterium]|jgi:elongation factor G|nr:elongation factor G [Vicinamibacteria bacterium]